MRVAFLRPRTSRLWQLIFFCIWPFGSSVSALVNFKKPQKRWLLLLLFVFFGYTMNFNSIGKDGYRLGNKFENFETPSVEEFLHVTFNSLPINPGINPDAYNYFIYSFLSLFTHNQRWYFAVHSLVFGFFAIRMYGRIYDDHEFEKLKGLQFFNVLPFFVGLIFFNSITNIHGVRFPVAASIFGYGMYMALKVKSFRNLAFLLLAPLVHFSFLIPVLLLYGYVFLGNRVGLYLIVLGVSYVLPNLLHSLLGSGALGDVGGEAIEHKTAAYSRIEYIANREEAIEKTNWYKRYSIPLLKISFLNVFYIALIYTYRKTKDIFFRNLFNFSILFLSFVNFGFTFDSLGRRFQMIWFILVSILMIRYICLNNSYKISVFTVIVLIPTILWTVLTLRVGLEYMSPVFLIGNPISALLSDVDLVIIDLIK